jgi:hypothetical protein
MCGARHRVAFDRGHDRAGLAGGVEQDGGGRAAVLGAVVDAAEHDEGRRRLEPESRRQEKRDGGRGPDARQYADGGAQRHADDRPHQDGRRERDGKSLRQRG